MGRQFEAMREYSRGALWVWPAAAVVLALVVGSALSAVDVSARSPLVFQGTADDARNLLIAIVTTIVTVIALILGLTVVALQLSSTQYSPRLLRNFLRDRPTQMVLSAFVATFAYSAAGLYTVGVANGDRTASFPRLAVTGALVLLFLSLFALVYEVHHVAHSMQIDEIMRKVENGTQEVVRSLPPEPGAATYPQAPPEAAAFRARRSGYIQVVHADRLMAVAARENVHVLLAYRVGDHVVSGSPLAYLWRSDGGPVDAGRFDAAMRDAVRLGFERTLEQDAAFGIRQLVDAASKALSPAVNDPYTAVQAIDHLAVIMASLARRHQGTAVHATAAGTTITVPAFGFADYLDLACAQIRRYGCGEPTVVRELLDLLGSTAHCTTQPDRVAAIRAQLDLLMADAERCVAQQLDLVPLRAAAERLAAQLST